MIISFNNVGYKYNDNFIFSKLSLSTWSSNLIRIVGSNGSGKTTLLKIISGILKPSCGNITIDDIDVSNYKISYLGHKLGLNLELSVIDNIIYWAELNNCIELVKPAICYYKLGNIADEKCYNLSEGQLKRVALAKVMSVYSNVWVLDEPETNLDPEFQERLFHAIRIRLMEGGIVIMATHLNIPLDNILTFNIDYFEHID
jgi:heme exporter protein A